jgi:hypothetical protein
VLIASDNPSRSMVVAGTEVASGLEREARMCSIRIFFAALHSQENENGSTLSMMTKTYQYL